jgi:tetratricopeptide (TPR) repeat protein
MLTLAQLYRGIGDLKLADARLATAESLASNNRQVFAERLRWLAAAGQDEAVWPHLARWRADHPEDLEIVVRTALFMAASGSRAELERARALLDEVIRLDPARADAANGLALCEYQLGNLDLATNAYRQVLERDPFNRQALNDLAWILGVELGQVAEGLELADRAVARYPDDPAILDSRGTLLLRAGRKVEARADLERCVEIEPLPSAVRGACLVHLAEVLLDDGKDTEVARERLNEAHRLDQEHAILDGATRSKLEELLRSLLQGGE